MYTADISCCDRLELVRISHKKKNVTLGRLINKNVCKINLKTIKIPREK